MAVIDHPTWENHIRHYFNFVDVSCMLGETHGVLNLEDYDSVTSLEVVESGRTMRDEINNRLQSRDMPLSPPSAEWSDDMLATYQNWINNQCPR